MRNMHNVNLAMAGLAIAKEHNIRFIRAETTRDFKIESNKRKIRATQVDYYFKLNDGKVIGKTIICSPNDTVEEIFSAINTNLILLYI